MSNVRFSKKQRYIINFGIILSFSILSILNVLLAWHHGILNGNDMYFHLDRLLELMRSKALFPRFAMSTFADNGSAVMTMYPYLLLCPFVILSDFITNFTTLVFVIFIVSLLTALLVSYYSSLRFSRSCVISYLFAICYVLSYEFLSLGFWSFDLGMMDSAIFLPLVLFGFIYWLRDNTWLMLSIGMSLIIYSNVPIMIFTPICLIIWTVLNYRLLNKQRLFNLAKAIILTLITTSAFWLPALKLMTLNKIYGGYNSTLGEGIRSVGLWHSLKATIDPRLSFLFNRWFPWELTIYALLGLIVSLLVFKTLNHFMKQAYILSILILVFSSNIFPWYAHVFYFVGGILQNTIRMYLIPQVFLTYLFAYVVGKLIIKCGRTRIKLINFIAVAFLVLIIQVGFIGIFHNQQARSIQHCSGALQSRYLKYTDVPHLDYYLGTKQSMNMIAKDQGTILIKHHNYRYKYIQPLGNGDFKFKNYGNLKKLSIPFLYYQGTDYKSYLDDKLIKSYPNHNHLLTINNIQPGTHQLDVQVPLDKVTILARILTIISLPIYGYIIVNHQRLSKLKRIRKVLGSLY